MDGPRISLPLQVVNDLLAYMGGKPYQEVYRLIAAVEQGAAPVSPQPETEDGGAEGTKPDG
jgi:hypothetical protein